MQAILNLLIMETNVIKKISKEAKPCLVVTIVSFKMVISQLT